MIAEISVNVSFLKHTLIKSDAGIVEGDYNTTKLVFNFEEDVSGKRIVFKMSNPAGELIFLKDLVDNEVLLVGKDADGYTCSLFPIYGLYPFELVCYGTESKLTSAPGWLNVSKRQVTVLDNVTTNYLPLFDKLLKDLGGNTIFLRFSKYADGTDFTSSYEDGQGYIGVAAGLTAPTDKAGYQWAPFNGVNALGLPFGKDIGDNSMALGLGSQAGAKGHYMSAIYINSNATGGKIYLSKTQQLPALLDRDDLSYSDSTFVSGYTLPTDKKLGFTVVYQENFDADSTTCNATIDSIEGNVVTFTGYMLTGLGSKFTKAYFNNMTEEDKAFPEIDDFSFMIPTQPDIGSHVVRDRAIAIGKSTLSTGIGATALGNGTRAYGKYSHAQGSGTTAYAYCSTAEGSLTHAKGMSSHAEGCKTHAIGQNSHAEGWNTHAVGDDSHAEGAGTYAGGLYSHAEGEGDGTNKYGAFGPRSHVEGYHTKAVKQDDHAEGFETTAEGGCSHAEGTGTHTTGWASHAEGNATLAANLGSHAEGLGTKTSMNYQHVQGMWNATGDFAHIVGGGTSDTNRKNIHTIDWSGNAVFAGSVTATQFNGEAKAPLVQKVISGTADFNSYTSSGWWVFAATEMTLKNKPEGGSAHWLEVFKYSNNYVLQRCTVLHNNYQSTLWQRVKSDGTWGSWMKIADSTMTSAASMEL